MHAKVRVEGLRVEEPVVTVYSAGTGIFVCTTGASLVVVVHVVVVDDPLLTENGSVEGGGGGLLVDRAVGAVVSYWQVRIGPNCLILQRRPWL